MAADGWEFWNVTTTDGETAWLGMTRPGARALIDREKVWTLLPRPRVFIANWFITADFRDGTGQWTYDNVDIDDARDLAIEVPDVSTAETQRITRPEAALTLDQVDRYPVVKVLGKQADAALAKRYR